MENHTRPDKPLPTIVDEQGRLRIIRAFFQLFQEAVELPVVFQRVYDTLPGLLQVSRASILLYEPELGALVSGDYIGAVHRGEALTSAPQAVGHSISGLCFAEVRPIVINDCSQSSVIPQDVVLQLQLKSTAAVPIMWKNSAIGVLRVDDGQKIGRFTNADIEVLQLVAEQLAAVVQNAQLLNDLKRREGELLRMNLELETARDAARKAGEAKGTFLTRVSHELRTPLNAILGYVELLRDDAQASGRTKLDMDLVKMRNAAGQLMTTIDNLLDLSRLEAGKANLRPESVNTRSAIEMATRAVEPAISRRSNRLEVFCPPGVPFLYADGVKLHQMLVSLLSNASEFTRRGTVSLTVEEERADEVRYVLIQVADNGAGVSPQELRTLLDAVYQVNGTSAGSAGQGQGMGACLGLAITRRLARLMGGELHGESTPGQGTTFTLRLPAVPIE